MDTEDNTDKYDSVSTFADEAVVLYTKTLVQTSAQDNNGNDVPVVTTSKAAFNDADTDEIKTMSVATLVTGEVTRKTGTTSFVMDGTTYEYSAGIIAADKNKVAVDSSADIYLDSYGYVIKVDEVDASKNFVVVLGVDDGKWGNGLMWPACSPLTAP